MRKKCPKSTSLVTFYQRNHQKPFPTKSCLDDIMTDQNLQNIFKKYSK